MSTLLVPTSSTAGLEHEHRQQQERAALFLALHRLSLTTDARAFADALADVCALNGQHGPLDEQDRAGWLRLGAALQIWLAGAGALR
jgi:hypothetical protein